MHLKTELTEVSRYCCAGIYIHYIDTLFIEQNRR